MPLVYHLEMCDCSASKQNTLAQRRKSQEANVWCCLPEAFDFLPEYRAPAADNRFVRVHLCSVDGLLVSSGVEGLAARLRRLVIEEWREKIDGWDCELGRKERGTGDFFFFLFRAR